MNHHTPALSFLEMIGALRKGQVVIEKVLLAVMLALALRSCAQPAERSYNGMFLPTPQPIRGFSEQPPPAWLIIDGQAIPATYGSFCVQGACADMVPPQLRNNLVSATVPAQIPITMIVQAQSIVKFHARIGTWPQQPTAPFDPAASHEIPAVRTSDGSITAFTLEPIGDAGDQLLAISLAFESGDASYLWRLNPVHTSESPVTLHATSKATPIHPRQCHSYA